MLSIPDREVDSVADLVIAAAEVFRKSNGDPQGNGDIDALHILDDQRVMFSTGAAGIVGTEPA